MSPGGNGERVPVSTSPGVSVPRTQSLGVPGLPGSGGVAGIGPDVRKGVRGADNDGGVGGVGGMMPGLRVGEGRKAGLQAASEVVGVCQLSHASPVEGADQVEIRGSRRGISGARHDGAGVNLRDGADGVH